MKSMTGYGKAKTLQDGIELEFELKSVNGRYLDLRLYLPREISFFEYRLRQSVAESISRGTLEIRASFYDHREPRLQLNELKLQKYNDLISQAAQILDLEHNTSLEFLLNEPGIIESADNLDEDPLLSMLLQKTLDQALHALVASLSAEAEQIRETLLGSSQLMLQHLDTIETQIQPYKNELYQNMKKRTTELLKGQPTENLEQRLWQELALYIDKYDIQEELTRLRSHIATLAKTLNRKDDNGKSLNFVLQEIQREANTLGSKFSTAASFPHILSLKEEVEKCREIVQNVA